MITTITLNPSVDKLYIVEDVKTNSVMRVKEVFNTAGGKGLNVSKVSVLLGEKTTATGFLGGYNGDYVRSMLESAGISTRFTQTSSETRSCINVRDLRNAKHTEYLEPGAEITQADLDRFLRVFEDILPHSEIITISGSAPKGTPSTFYADIISLCRSAHKKTIVDTSGELLVESLKAKPTLIKPNADEIEQLTCQKAASREQIISAAKKLHEDGIEYVAVSLGADGSVFVCRDGVYFAQPPPINAVNTVGCGDSMTAGFAVSLSRGYSITEMLRFSTAAAAANALELQTGHIRTKNLEDLLPQVKVMKIS